MLIHANGQGSQKESHAFTVLETSFSIKDRPCVLFSRTELFNILISHFTAGKIIFTIQKNLCERHNNINVFRKFC